MPKRVRGITEAVSDSIRRGAGAEHVGEDALETDFGGGAKEQEAEACAVSGRAVAANRPAAAMPAERRKRIRRPLSRAVEFKLDAMTCNLNVISDKDVTDM